MKEEYAQMIINDYSDVLSVIEGIIEQIDERKEKLHLNKDKLNKKFKNACSKNEYVDDEYNPILYSGDEFERRYNVESEYVDRQRKFIEKLQKICEQFERKNSESMQLLVLITDCLENINSDLLYYDLYDGLNDGSFGEEKTDYDKDYKSILLLSEFAQYDSNIILIGGNGSGKSMLASILKGYDTQNITVIPAQKYLYCSTDGMDLQSGAMRAQESLLENGIELSKGEGITDYGDYQLKQFTDLILATREQLVDYLLDCKRKGVVANDNNTVFEKMREIFSELFPEIELEIASWSDEKGNIIKCIKGDDEYTINSLSEGEKAVVYYALSVLLSKENSFVIVDEPETFLNPSISSRLWDYLVESRNDCKFIFISHSVDFVLSRYDSRIVWIKKYTYPDIFEYQEVEEIDDFPKELLTEILGTKKPLLLCEGDNKGSLDYLVYKALLGDRYAVIPVGSKTNVEKCCKAVKMLPQSNIDCYGIVDLDFDDERKIKKLEDHNIYTLPFNEIEMLLVSDEVVSFVIKKVYPQNGVERINIFKEKFWEKIQNEKKTIVLQYLKGAVEKYLETEKIRSYKTLEDIKDGLRSISNYDLEEQRKKIVEYVDEAIDKNDYDKILKVCNLKKAVSRGLANDCFGVNYEELAEQHIHESEELRQLLLNKFFYKLC